jgi:hypothetical protein
MKLRSLIPNFHIHVSVSYLFIPRIDLPMICSKVLTFFSRWVGLSQNNISRYYPFKKPPKLGLLFSRQNEMDPNVILQVKCFKQNGLSMTVQECIFLSYLFLFNLLYCTVKSYDSRSLLLSYP